MKQYRYKCIYVKNGETKQITLMASSRGMAIIGLCDNGIKSSEIISLEIDNPKYPFLNSDEYKDKKRALIESIKLTQSGYAGIDKDGKKVDRRLHPDAVPLQENKKLNIPKPKKVK